MAHETATIDLDDFVIPSAPAIAAHYDNTYGIEVPLGSFYSKDPAVWGVSDPDVAIRRIYEYYESEEYAQLQPSPESLECLPLLARYFDLHILTGRPDFLRQLTEEVLERHLPGVFVDFHFTNYTSPKGGPIATKKSEIARKVNARWHGDDHTAHAIDVANAGITSYLGPEQPWNRGVGMLLPKVVRVSGLAEITKLVLAEEAA
jgi:hypothetical protein